MADVMALADTTAPDMNAVLPDEKDAPQNEQALVRRILATIKSDMEHHKDAFKRMKCDMHVAKYGRLPEASKDHYTANIAGRFVKQKTAALYAKNPKATARRRPTLDFRLWDENPDTLKLAYQAVQQGQLLAQQQAAAAAQGDLIDPRSGQISPAEIPMSPELEQAQALLEDFQQGSQRRQLIQRTGKTLELLFAQATREQKPLDFKTGMKKLVRRSLTTGVGYVELGFQRDTGPRPGLVEQLADFRQRLDHIRNLHEQQTEGDFGPDDSEAAELENSIRTLESEPEIVVREGLLIDYPMSTKVIPDKLCKSLVGFVGARHLSIEYLFSADEVRELFDVDPKDFSTASTDKNGTDAEYLPQMEFEFEDDSGSVTKRTRGSQLVKVWKHYDKPSGMMYFVAEGCSKFLRAPAAPDVFVEDFWPVYALTFNDVEHEDELYPPSDVALALDMQLERNRARQGKREHRRAARPRFAAARGSLGDDDLALLKGCEPFEVVLLGTDPQTNIGQVLQSIPVPGVDPNLYDTGEIEHDLELVVGSASAQFGGTSKATATESAIAANSSTSADSSSVDDLDSFLSLVARASGQILLREVSEETATKVAGIGAVWPHLTLSEIADELYLEIEAGSTGKPNQAVQVNNAKTLVPFLLQTGQVSPFWLAKYLIGVLDDKIDLTDAVIEGIPSIVAQNSQQQPMPPNPANAPQAQGPQGGANAPAPPGGEGGSAPAFGSNQV